MRTCGSNRWWFDDTKLILRRVNGLKEWVKGLGALLLTGAGVALHPHLPFSLGVEGALTGGLFAAVGVIYGLYSTLGTWEVSFHRLSGQVSWRWGLGFPFLRRTRTVTLEDRVQLCSPNAPSKQGHIKGYTLELAGVEKTHLLAGSDDPAEALELAEALARHLRVGLQVDGGRIRPFEELKAPGRVSELRDPQVPDALVPPPDCRIQVRDEGGQCVAELPATGWVGRYRRQVGISLLFFLISAVGAWMLKGIHEAEQFLAMLPLTLLPGAVGLFLIWKARKGAHTTWRLSVSRRGLELVRSGGGKPQTIRVPIHLLRDLDVREHLDARGAMDVHTHSPEPLLVIDRTEDGPLEVGAGLSREALEWAAARLRQGLTRARREEAERQETALGAVERVGVR